MSEEQNMLDVTGCLPDYLRELSDKCGRLAASADFVEAMVNRESDHLLRIGELEEESKGQRRRADEAESRLHTLHVENDRLHDEARKLAAEADRERGTAEKAAADYIDLNARYDKLVAERYQLHSRIDQMKAELQGTRDALKRHADGESGKSEEINRLKTENEQLRTKVSGMSNNITLLKSRIDGRDSRIEALEKTAETSVSSDPIVRAVMELPTWRTSDAFKFEGSDTSAVLFCLKSFMENKGIDTAKELENLLESAQDCRNLREKFNDMSDAFEDWANDMPSTDPDDY